MRSTNSGVIVAVATKKKMARGMRAMLLVLTGVAIGFISRFLIDALINQFPGGAQYIDVVGQLLVALIVGWFCLIPILEDYGVIRGSKRSNHD